METDAKRRWDLLSSLSKPIQIGNVNIFGGKTPYRNELTLQYVVSCIRQDVPDLRQNNKPIVFDLTNSNAYYDEQRLSRADGCLYIKIACEGRAKTPSSSVVDYIMAILESKIDRSPGASPAVVFIHCTHGCNRTGFVIVSLLMRFGIYNDVDAAIDYFLNMRRGNSSSSSSSSRPVMKNAVRAALLSAYRTVADAEIRASCSVHLMPMDKSLQSLLTPTMQMLQLREGQALPRKKTFLGAMPKMLTVANIATIKSKAPSFWVTPKADGVRYLVLVDQKGVYALGRQENGFSKIQRVCVRFAGEDEEEDNVHLRGYGSSNSDSDSNIGPFLFDCELIEKPSGSGNFVLLAFDILHSTLGSLISSPFALRYGELHLTLNELRRTIPLPIVAKPFYPMSSPSKILLVQEDPGYKTDGYIFYDTTHPYSSEKATDVDVFKWKDVDTVDFSVSESRTNGNGLPPPLPLPPPLHLYVRKGNEVVKVGVLDPADGQVVREIMRAARSATQVVIECRIEGGDEGPSSIRWRFVRHRDDRETANALLTYQNIVNAHQHRIIRNDIFFSN